MLITIIVSRPLIFLTDSSQFCIFSHAARSSTLPTLERFSSVIFLSGLLFRFLFNFSHFYILFPDNVNLILKHFLPRFYPPISFTFLIPFNSLSVLHTPPYYPIIILY